MIIPHFSIYDEVTQIYNLPFQAHNINDAKRMFITASQDESTNLSKNPQDYSLYYVADYDNETGNYTTIHPKEFLLRGVKPLPSIGE